VLVSTKKKLAQEKSGKVEKKKKREKISRSHETEIAILAKVI